MFSRFFLYTTRVSIIIAILSSLTHYDETIFLYTFHIVGARGSVVG
jgi:hypothetical protein